jgi:hypothetical protein
MMLRIRAATLTGWLVLAGCGGSDEPSPVPSLGCEATLPVELAPGEAALVDPAARGGCLRLPASTDGAEHLVVAVSAAGVQVGGGIAASYRLEGAGGSGASALRTSVRATAVDRSRPARFHQRLRQVEAGAALRPRVGATSRAALREPPVVGQARTFQVCADLDCGAFVAVSATARYVGRQAAIYLDDTVPAGGLTPAELDTLGALFDQQIHPLDTTAFGRESDIDGDGLVSILLSDAVNALSGDCRDGVVLGYFLGLDLLPAEPGSNGGEVFYSRVPDASLPACQHTRAAVLRELPRVFIHEFQHMISFNQRVLLRGGGAEHVWLNEALSHFAEELGGRYLTGTGALGDAPSRASQFQRVNVLNAFDYLADPESYFLVVPGSSFGSTPERGAGWLFVRWLADHYGDGSVAGTAVTRALLAGSAAGSANVEAVAGRPFAELVGMWQLANFLDDLPGVSMLDTRLEYRSVNLRSTFGNLFPVYPLRPDSVTATYAHQGVLRAGSGRHVRVVQPAGAAAVELRLADPAGGAVNGLAAVRYAVARLR